MLVKEPRCLVKALSTNPEYLQNKAAESRQVVGDKDRQIVTPRTFAMLCFRLVKAGAAAANSDHSYYKEEGTAEEEEEVKVLNELNRQLLESINSPGKAYMTHAVVGGVYMIRFTVGASLTEEYHVVAAWKSVQEDADALLLDGAGAGVANGGHAS